MTPLRVLCAAGACLALSSVACTPKRAYRVPENRIQTSIVEIRDDEMHRAEVERHCVEEHPDFSLAFVEFDDRGRLWEPAQMDSAEQLIVDEAGGEDGPGVVVVVFVHGWKHNASICDENVACFREMLTGLDNLGRVQAAAGGFEPRRVVGVYLGWRGLSVKARFFKELTFYERKRTAHRIGEGDVLGVFRRLEALRERLNVTADRSRLVIIGHSFGGAITFSAVSSLFEERLASNPDGDLVRGVGDLVVLVNPAFEAARYTTIHELARSHTQYDEAQPTNLIVITSDTDRATRKFFRRGRVLSTMFMWAWSKATKQLKRVAVGHYPPYRTHRLEPASSRGELLPDIVERSEEEARGVNDCRCRYIEVGSLDAGEVDIAADTADPVEMAFSGVDLKPVQDDNSPRNPFWMIGTNDEVITRHNGIYNRVFVDFVRSFLVLMEVNEASGEAGE